MYPYNSLLDIGDRTLTGFALADTAGQTGAFGLPIAIFPWVENHLPHRDHPFRLLDVTVPAKQSCLARCFTAAFNNQYGSQAHV